MKNRRGGFTLVEVMTVVLLFGMLLLLIFPMRRMLFRVMEREEAQEHAEMVGDAVFRYVTDGLQTGSIRREDLGDISLDKFGEDDLIPEISIEDAGGYRMYFRVNVSDGERILYERAGNILYPGDAGKAVYTDGNAVGE